MAGEVFDINRHRQAVYREASLSRQYRRILLKLDKRPGEGVVKMHGIGCHSQISRVGLEQVDHETVAADVMMLPKGCSRRKPSRAVADHDRSHGLRKVAVLTGSKIAAMLPLQVGGLLRKLCVFPREQPRDRVPVCIQDRRVKGMTRTAMGGIR